MRRSAHDRAHAPPGALKRRSRTMSIYPEGADQAIFSPSRRTTHDRHSDIRKHAKYYPGARKTRKVFQPAFQNTYRVWYIRVEFFGMRCWTAPAVTHRVRPVEVMAFCSFIRLSSGLGLWCNVILRLDVPIGAELVCGIPVPCRRSSHRAGGMGKDRSICAVLVICGYNKKKRSTRLAVFPHPARHARGASAVFPRVFVAPRELCSPPVFHSYT